MYSNNPHPVNPLLSIAEVDIPADLLPDQLWHERVYSPPPLPPGSPRPDFAHAAEHSTSFVPATAALLCPPTSPDSGFFQPPPVYQEQPLPRSTSPESHSSFTQASYDHTPYSRSVLDSQLGWTNQLVHGFWECSIQSGFTNQQPTASVFKCSMQLSNQGLINPSQDFDSNRWDQHGPVVQSFPDLSVSQTSGYPHDPSQEFVSTTADAVPTYINPTQAAGTFVYQSHWDAAAHQFDSTQNNPPTHYSVVGTKSSVPDFSPFAPHLSSSPIPMSGHRWRRKSMIQFTEEQDMIMEDSFLVNPYCSRREKENLARQCGIPLNHVMVSLNISSISTSSR